MELNSQSTLKSKSFIPDRLWKINDIKAQKNGTHNTIYWVKQQNKFEDGTYKGEKWRASSKYTGSWKDNKKHGYGVQYYNNGQKYEGMWENNERNGQGTLWIPEKENKNKLKRKYTGDWKNNKKEGRGTMFYENEDRYDGFWKNGKPSGEGRIIYKNGDVYIGQWADGNRSGYGILTKRNGDHFEGQWVENKREGQGSYYFAKKGKIMIGQWSDDNPKTVVYSHLENEKIIDENSPDLPILDLENPEEILENALNKVIKERMFFRAKYMAIHILFSPDELEIMIDKFTELSKSKNFINLKICLELLDLMEINVSLEKLQEMIYKVYNEERELLEFEDFVRLVAIFLESNNELEEQDITNLKNLEKNISKLSEISNSNSVV